MFSIERVCYFTPNTYLSVEESAAHFKITPQQSKAFARIYGLKNIAFANNETLLEMLVTPIQALFASGEIKKESIRFLIHAHTAKVLVPFPDSLVEQIKDFFSLSQTVVFGMSMNNCAAIFDALEMAAYFLMNESSDAKAIIVSGEKAFTPSVQVIPNTSITGDAAAACLIGLHGKTHRLLAMHRMTYGAYAKGIWMEAEEAKDFEKHYVVFLIEVVQAALEQAAINKNQLKWIIPHNVNLISWFRFAKEFGFDRNKIFLNNVEKYGHCFGSDVFINYADLIQSGSLCPGDYYLMVTVGLGAIFAAAVFQY